MLGGTMGAATQTASQTIPRVDKPSVLVIGAGLIGSSVAMQLAKKGCPVTVLEASAQPAAGAQTSFDLHSESIRQVQRVMLQRALLQVPVANLGRG